ncbi:hypothetical protein SKAU_G00014730 [Synaphobranchus kaupii]|uniref:Uncharacterized protein n=1 Tax=Synaphobranchus kaupii TaxID=118154 RepID=A0A9Q1GBU7_SYNKA|nr:hypothetical protein SKAU_G00014730 [Synaphobranchus kaupii]
MVTGVCARELTASEEGHVYVSWQWGGSGPRASRDSAATPAGTCRTRTLSRLPPRRVLSSRKRIEDTDTDLEHRSLRLRRWKRRPVPSGTLDVLSNASSSKSVSSNSLPRALLWTPADILALEPRSVTAPRKLSARADSGAPCPSGGRSFCLRVRALSGPVLGIRPAGVGGLRKRACAPALPHAKGMTSPTYRPVLRP